MNLYVKIFAHFLNIAKFAFPYSSFKIINIYLNNDLGDTKLNYSSALVAYFLTGNFVDILHPQFGLEVGNFLVPPLA